MNSVFGKNLFVNGIPTILGTLQRGGFFPDKDFLIDTCIQKIKNENNPSNIIRRIIKDSKFIDFLSEQILNDRCAIFCSHHYSETRKLVGFNYHALVTENYSLQNCLDKDLTDVKWFYYRLDFDLLCGKIFKEDIPHLHISPKGEPRIPFPVAYCENPLFAFIEFIYRNHFYNEWCLWVKSIVENKIEFSDDFLPYLDPELKISKTWTDMNTDFSKDIEKLRDALSQNKKDISQRFPPILEEYKKLNYKIF